MNQPANREHLFSIPRVDYLVEKDGTVANWEVETVEDWEEEMEREDACRRNHPLNNNSNTSQIHTMYNQNHLNKTHIVGCTSH